MTTNSSLEEKEARRNLMLAACRVIGRKGYKAASISRIAEEAGIAIGSCYKYFPSRDAILENVIIWILEEFEEFSAQNIHNYLGYVQFEGDILKSYFDFQEKYPFFLKILRDSEVETPQTWARFTAARAKTYLSALCHAYHAGKILGYEERQLPDLSMYLSAIRKSIVFKYAEDPAGRPAAITLYQRFVTQALGGSSV